MQIVLSFLGVYCLAKDHTWAIPEEIQTGWVEDITFGKRPLGNSRQNKAVTLAVTHQNQYKQNTSRWTRGE